MIASPFALERTRTEMARKFLVGPFLYFRWKLTMQLKIALLLIRCSIWALLARHRATPPLDGSSPPLPARPYDVAATTAVGSTAAGGGRRTTVEDGA